MANKGAGNTPNDSNFVEVGSGFVFGSSHCDSDWDIRGRAQYHMCINVLKSTIACMHVLVSEVAKPSKERLS